MNKIAKELVEVAKSLVAAEPNYEAYEILLKEVKKGNPVLTAQDIHDDIPTIHTIGKPKYRKSVEHLGFGMFRGETDHGSFDFDAGGAMNRVGNIGWTRLNAENDVLRDLRYNLGKVKRALLELLEDRD